MIGFQMVLMKKEYLIYKVEKLRKVFCYISLNILYDEYYLDQIFNVVEQRQIIDLYIVCYL